MGDSTMRQIWATIASPLSSGEFEKNAKEWSRENVSYLIPNLWHFYQQLLVVCQAISKTKTAPF